MKKYLIVVCAAAALVGCANNRGGMSDRSTRESGSGTYDRSSTNNLNSTTNNSSGANSSSVQGSTSERSSGAGSQDNSTPKN